MYQKKTKENYKQFVCPDCFQQLQDCECKFFPWQLIFIDEHMQETVRKFNRKGYTTSGCCEGHMNVVSFASVHICFRYDFPEIMELIEQKKDEMKNLGIKYAKSKHAIICEIPKKKLDQIGEEGLAEIRGNVIRFMNNLCDELPERTNNSR